MTDTSSTAPRARLRAGTLIGGCFSICFGNLLNVVLIGVGPLLAAFCLIAGLGFSMNRLGLGTGVGERGETGFVLATVAITVMAYAVVNGLLVQLAYDAQLGRKLRPRTYISRALTSSATLSLLGLVILVLVGVAATVAIWPVDTGSPLLLSLVLMVGACGWIVSAFSVTAPAVVIERAGLRALGRSLQLTRGYRWPIFGVLLLVGILAMVVVFVGVMVGAVANVTLVSVIVITLSTSVSFGLVGITVALVYARLREIKDGVSVDEIASIFD
jgi:hypothetical protein